MKTYVVFLMAMQLVLFGYTMAKGIESDSGLPLLLLLPVYGRILGWW